ncbi:MAG: PAS domain S-box protein [Flavobacteriales bacterium]|nr:PAS domain S-box protein [Flavobacteriales bacterium]
MALHKILNRQLNKHLSEVDVSSPEFQRFLTSISNTYKNIDDNQKILSRAMDISSQELNETLESLSRQNNTHKKTLKSLNELLIDLGGESTENYEEETFLIEGLKHQINEKRKAESKLIHDEERLRLLVDSVDVGLYDSNYNTGEYYYSSGYARMLGYNKKGFKLSFSNWVKRIHPEDRDRIIKKYNTVDFNEQNYQMEYRIKHKEGHYLWILSKGRVIEKDRNGKPLRTAGTHTDITERKETEVELKKYFAVMEHSTDFVGIASLEGKLLYVNPYGRELVGLDSIDQVKQTRIEDFHTKEAFQLSKEVEQPEILKNGFYRGVSSLRHFKTKEVINTSVRSFLIKDPETKQPIYLATIQRDIRERLINEKKRKEDEEKLRVIYESNLFGIHIDDFLSGEVHANQAFCDMLGYTQKEISDKKVHFDKITHPDYLAESHRNFEMLMKGEQKGFLLNKKYIKKNGEVVDAVTAVRGVYSSSGEIIQVFATILDVTEQKRSEKELRNLSLIASKTTNGVFLCDKNGEIEWCNESMEELMGYSLDEMMGRLPSVIFNGKLVQTKKVQKIINQYQKKPTPFNIEVTAYKKNGNMVWLAVSNTPIFDNEGKLVNQIEIISDISESKEEEKREKEREENLLKEIIETERAERERLSRELHDGICQTLTAVSIGFKKYLYGTKFKDPDFISTLELLDNSVVEIRNLSHNLLPEVIRDFGLIAALQDVVDSLEKRSIAEFKLNSNFKKPLGNLELPIYRVIQEATNNIVKHAKATKVKIDLTIKRNSLFIIIKDNGVGFTLKDVGETFGIDSMKSRVKSMNGKIDVVSELKKGTSIKIKIPLKEDE